MDADQKKMLEEKGFDVDGTMKRFLNNETLYLKCPEVTCTIRALTS